jgi:hypothetical protein
MLVALQSCENIIDDFENEPFEMQEPTDTLIVYETWANASYLTPAIQIIAAGIALVASAYVVSMLIAWRIRKISAYSLISE